MILKEKVAVIYGGGGAIGGAVAKAFAAEGALVFLTGRNLASVDPVAKEILATSGVAETARVDALEEKEVEAHLATVIRKAGRVDVSFNAITPVPQPGVQGISLAELPVESFTAPITAYLRSNFLTARAAARRMVEKRSGVILMSTPEPARLGAPFVGGMGPAWAAMEALSRNLSAEFGRHGVRSVVIRSNGMPETKTIDVVFGLHAKALGIPQEAVTKLFEGLTHRQRATTLAEVANTAVFLASGRGSGLTGTVANLTGGTIVD